MARKKGAANRYHSDSTGKVLNRTIKVRVNDEWLDIVNSALPDTFYLKDRSFSFVVRYLVMKGLLHYCNDKNRLEQIRDHLASF